MNDISSLSSSLYTPQVSGQNPISSVAGQDADGDNDGGSGVRRGGRRGEFASAVFQALSQAGITLPNPGGSAGSSTSGQDSDGGNDGSAQSGSAQQALHAFMHSLFQALSQNAPAQGQKPSSGSDSDGDNDGSQSGASGAIHHHGGHRQQFAADAQQLLQSLASGSDSATSSLESSFQNLLQTLGSSSSSGAAQPSLQSFLQALVQNLGGSAPQPSGNLVQSQA